MVCVSTLSAATISDITNVLIRNGSSLTGKGLKAVTVLIETLEAGLKGELEDQYYLSAMDPGMGKTLAVSRFLKIWRDRGYQPSSSVIIGVSRKQEIQGYMEASALQKDDVAVLTSDPDWNDLGVPQDRHGELRVLFTTQQMIQSRARGKSFAGIVEFFYQDKPRVLRIWDESLVPEDPVVLKIDDLGRIASAFTYRQRQDYAPFLVAVDDFKLQLRDAAHGEAVWVPDQLDVGNIKKTEDKLATSACRALSAFSGTEALAVGDRGRGQALVGSSPTLPGDFAPAVVVDASGRVRETYRLWENGRGNLRRLPSAQNDFSDLSIGLWQRGCGKDALANGNSRSVIVRAIADEILKEAGEWLIVHYKSSPETFTELQAAIGRQEDIKLHSLTWGMHHGTNLFSHVSNVVIVGQSWLPEHMYPALACAASGLPPSQAGALNFDDLKWGEFQHDLLQALCRASVRRSVGGRAGRCRAYVIATPSAQTFDRIKFTFPGCRIWAWNPDVPRINGKVSAAIAYLENRFADGSVDEVLKKEVRDHLGMAASNFSKDVIKHGSFEEFMGRSSIEEIGQRFKKHRVHFDPQPGGFLWDVSLRE